MCFVREWACTGWNKMWDGFEYECVW